MNPIPLLLVGFLAVPAAPEQPLSSASAPREVSRRAGPTSCNTAGAEYAYATLAVPEGFPDSNSETIDRQPNVFQIVLDTRCYDGFFARSLRGGHVVGRLLPCDEARFHCFRTSSTHFAVPKGQAIRVGQQWQESGATFDVIRTEDLAALGVQVRTYVIRTPNKAGGDNYFYWSDTAGLVAIRSTFDLHGRASVQSNMIEGAKGFPF